MERVHIFIDNSNLWIEGQKCYAEKHSLEVSWDPTWRFDVGRLKKLLTSFSNLRVDRERCEVMVNLYGSTPPPVDTVWGAIRSHDVHVSTFARSAWNKREKEVDAEIIADSVEAALVASHDKVRCDFIIVSGDRDLHRAVEKIKKYGFPVHIWSWKRCLASVYTKDADIDVYKLDEHLEEIGFRESTFRVDRNVISPHSIVVLDPVPQAEAIQAYVSTLRVPVYRYVSTKKRDDSSSEDLIIIPAFAARMEDDELTRLFQDAETRLGKSGLSVLTYANYLQRFRLVAEDERSHELALSNRFQELLELERESSSEGDVAETASYVEDENDGFTRVNSRSEKRKEHLKRDEMKGRSWCNFRKYCDKGISCKYGHTQEEIAYFKAHGITPARKFKFCNNSNCFRGRNCKFAHVEEELFCPTCGRTGAGHDMTCCPERSRNKSHD